MPLSIFSPSRHTPRPPPPFNGNKLTPTQRQRQIELWEELRADGRALAYAKLVGLWSCSAPGHYNLCSCNPGYGSKKQELTKELVKHFRRAGRRGTLVEKSGETRELKVEEGKKGMMEVDDKKERVAKQYDEQGRRM